MYRQFLAIASSTLLAMFIASGICEAQVGYGVNGRGQLFRFLVNAPAPAPVTNIGAPLPFVPEGIDFRPSSQTLYAIDVGPNTTQLYTIDITTGIPTPVGPGFTSTGVVPAPYDLTTTSLIGFDFNPKTLQGDGSMRIRLVNSANQNLRLNSTTGLIANVDTQLVIPPTDSPFVEAVAYINNIAEVPGAATTLYDMDRRNYSLYTQDPPNNGTLNLVGAFGVSDATARIHFDIFTDPASVDSTIGGDFGYAVFPRVRGPYMLYNVDLATGQTLQGRLVGSAVTPANFNGGFAVLPIPEPSCIVQTLIAVLALTCSGRQRRS